MKSVPLVILTLVAIVSLHAPFAAAQPESQGAPLTPPLPIGFDPNAAPPAPPPTRSLRTVTPPVRVVPGVQPVAQPVRAPHAPATTPSTTLTVLAFDESSKRVTAKPGDPNVPFTFGVTNISDADVIINQVRTSCGCTAAQLPPMPWKLAPGESGSFGVTMNIAGKVGNVTKVVTIYSSVGTTNLTVTSEIPADAPDSPEMMDRLRNQRIAAADRQAIFKGDCASCHAEPVVGKLGAELYTAACGICHEAEHRASMVPDLRALPQDATSEYWRQFVVHGKPGTLMPAFAQSEQGPLTDEQVDSLVDYLSVNFDPKKQEHAVQAVEPHLHGSSGDH